ncbi:hypothetical protein [Methylocystis sp.]|uniref:hypothetical protein n=1 Tax=Methylocystis sp. TaxID=1911079 RepID=UPI003D0BBCD0
MSGISNLARFAMGTAGAGALVGGYGEYRSGMAEAGAIDASRPYDLINAANQAKSLRYGADTALAGAQRRAEGSVIDKNMALSRAKAVAGASGAGASDATVVNQEALIENQGEFNKALEMFGGQDQFNQMNSASDNALIEGVNTYNSKGVQASRLRSSALTQGLGTFFGGARTMFDIYGKAAYRQYPKTY